MMIHPEQKKDEKFVGNGIKTAKKSENYKYRVGKQAYDINGKKILNENIVPIFVMKKDLYDYDKFMHEKTFKIRFPYSREHFNQIIGL